MLQGFYNPAAYRHNIFHFCNSSPRCSAPALSRPTHIKCHNWKSVTDYVLGHATHQRTTAAHFCVLMYKHNTKRRSCTDCAASATNKRSTLRIMLLLTSRMCLLKTLCTVYTADARYDLRSIRLSGHCIALLRTTPATSTGHA